MYFDVIKIQLCCQLYGYHHFAKVVGWSLNVNYLYGAEFVFFFLILNISPKSNLSKYFVCGHH